MADTTTPPTDTTAPVASCCDAKAQATCCDASEKSTCCAQPSSGTCGCR